MAMQRASETAEATSVNAAPKEAATGSPVREYISALALELAQMARGDGDEALGRLLESAASLAGEPLTRFEARPVKPGLRRRA
jgi:hypothetical protein